MSAIARYGPLIARSSTLVGQKRLMATATASQLDPIQRLFLDKVKEFKTSSKGLDAKHQQILKDELERLKRVYGIEDVNKISQLNYKFADEVDVSIRDLEENRELRSAIASNSLKIEENKEEESALLASIPKPITAKYHLPAINKPDFTMLLPDDPTKVAPCVPSLGEPVEDYKVKDSIMTPFKLQRLLKVMFGPNMPTIHDDANNPQRDLKNFPRIKQPLETPPARHGLIPESYFTFLYPKLGASGFYTLTGGFSLFLLSKEWVPIEHHFLAIPTVIIIFSSLLWKYGEKLSEYTSKVMKAQDQEWLDWQQRNIDLLEDIKQNYKAELAKDNLINAVYDARENDVSLQLESEYRRRVKKVFDDTKRKLNYLVSVAETENNVTRRNMVNWVIENSTKTIGAKQESEVLDNCIGNLKKLSVKYANVV